jgi:hypothetical protein
MAKRAAVCLSLALTLVACRQEAEPPPPVPLAAKASPEPASSEVRSYQRPEPPLSEVEPDAYCEVEHRRYERRSGVWVQAGYEDRPAVRTVILGQDPELERQIGEEPWLQPVLNLGRVRVWVGEDLVEVMNDDFSHPYEGALCETRGKVRLPRNFGPMGSALEEQLRRDSRWRGRSFEVRFVVDQDGRVRELISSGGLSQYSDLLLQDLREVRFQPATLDGHPVAVIHSADLQY